VLLQADPARAATFVVNALGGNVVQENPSTSGQQQCASTSTDAWPVLITSPTGLWGTTTQFPLSSGSLPFYDPTLVATAIDFNTCPVAVTDDQVGNPRPSSPGTCDAGAYEL
jgi:hypothetical protein